MPKGAKKRAKLKKQQQQGHTDDDSDNAHHNGNGSGSDNNNAAPGRRDHGLRILPKDSNVDGSDDSIESSEEMVTPRTAGSEPDEEERKAAPDAPPMDHAAEAADNANNASEGDAGEEVMVDALPPETSGQGKDDAEVEVHAVVQEPEVKDVVVDEAPEAQEPVEVSEAPVVEVTEVTREVAKVHPVHEPEEPPKVDEAVLAGESVVHVSEVKDGNVVVKDSTEVSLSREVDVHTTEARGPVVAVAAAPHRATWWNCCGLFDAFSGSER